MLNTVKVNLIDDNIVHLSFPTSKEQALSLFRISEHYESPHSDIKGKYFSIELFLDTYMTDKGHLKYFNYWDGFNVPGCSINKFYSSFHEMTRRELQLKGIIESCVIRNNPYYLISTVNNNKILFNHEFSHAKYYLDDQYRESVNECIDQIPKDILTSIKNSLIAMGYCDDHDILYDEINAYFSTSNKTTIKSYFDIEYSELEPYILNLKKKFKAMKKLININTII